MIWSKSGGRVIPGGRTVAATSAQALKLRLEPRANASSCDVPSVRPTRDKFIRADADDDPSSPMASAQRCAKDLEGLVLLADYRPVGGQRDGGLPLAPGGSPTATISAPHVHRYASPASGQWHSASTRTRHAQSSWTHVSKVPGPYLPIYVTPSWHAKVARQAGSLDDPPSTCLPQRLLKIGGVVDTERFTAA
jgi:hypothetical protein